MGTGGMACVLAAVLAVISLSADAYSGRGKCFDDDVSYFHAHSSHFGRTVRSSICGGKKIQVKIMRQVKQKGLQPITAATPFLLPIS